MRVVVSIPTYEGKLPVHVVRCLLDERLIASGIGVDMQFNFLPGCSHPAMGRSQLAHDFYESGADRLFFLDADITFEPGSIIKLLHMPVDIVGGAYRYKVEREDYPIGWIPEKELWSDKHGLLEVESLPGGFTCISRRVFEKFQEAFPERWIEHFGKRFFAYYQMRFEDGKLWGEDSYFCREWREMGEKVYLYPELELTHWDGNKPFKGKIGSWLKARLK